MIFVYLTYFTYIYFYVINQMVECGNNTCLNMITIMLCINRLDCIGILKLRNADVERRIGPKRARDKKKNNTKARLVLRAAVETSDGAPHILQVASRAIVCSKLVLKTKFR